MQVGVGLAGGVRDFWVPPFERRRLSVAVWARGHLGAGYLGADRLGAGLIKNQNSASGSGISEKNRNITELEAGFMLIMYTSLSEIEGGLMQEIISKCMLYC